MSVCRLHGCTAPPAKNAPTAACAAAEVAAEHRVAGVGDDQQLRVGDLRGDALGAGGGRPQVLGAGEDQRGHVRQRPGEGGAEASGQFSHDRDRPRLQRRGRVEGVEVRAGNGAQGAEGFFIAGRRRCRAAARGTASPRRTWRRTARCSSSSLAARSGFRVGLDFGHIGDEPFGEQVEAQQRVGVVAQRRPHGRRQQRPQRGVEVARLQDQQQVELSERHRVAVAAAVIGGASELVLAQLGGQSRQVRRADWR